MTNWVKITLGDAITLQRGHDLPKTNMNHGCYPVAGSNGIIGWHDKFTTKAIGVTIGRSGNIGNAYIYNTDFWAHNTTLYVKDFKGNDPVFIYYFLKNIDFNSFNAGSAVPTLNRNHIHPIPIFLPPLTTQKAIAEVLSSLDDKIDLLHRQNKTLEQMAETLFRQWFVEEASVKRILGDCIKTTSGGTPSRKKIEYYENGIYQWVKSKELNGGYILGTEEKITEEALKNSSAKILPKNSVLIAMYGATVGQYAIIGQETTCNQAICACIPNDEFPYTFIYHTIKSNVEELKNRAVGSAQQNISQDIIKSLYIPINDKINLFHLQVHPMMRKIKSNYKQICILTNMRDSLLPNLINDRVKLKL